MERLSETVERGEVAEAKRIRYKCNSSLREGDGRTLSC